MKRWCVSAGMVLALACLACGAPGEGEPGISAPPPLSTDLPVGQLLDDPEAKALLERHFGAQVNRMRAVSQMTLEQLIPMSGGRLTPEIIEQLQVEFEALNRARAG